MKDPVVAAAPAEIIEGAAIADVSRARSVCENPTQKPTDRLQVLAWLPAGAGYPSP
jgi:hypothetical protein